MSRPVLSDSADAVAANQFLAPRVPLGQRLRNSYVPNTHPACARVLEAIDGGGHRVAVGSLHGNETRNDSDPAEPIRFRPCRAIFTTRRPMNTANLQLQGILAVLASLLQTIERKGVLPRTAIDSALNQAEMEAVEGAQNQNSLSDAHLEAIRFPARYLRMALAGRSASYEATATAVGRAKDDEEDGA
jgi:hypothetical protein